MIPLEVLMGNLVHLNVLEAQLDLQTLHPDHEVGKYVTHANHTMASASSMQWDTSPHRESKAMS